MSGNSGLHQAGSEEHRLIKQRAGEFTLFLVKAILQTGTYSADHPVAKAALTDMYSMFRDMTAQAHELTYVLTSAMDEKGVMLDGLLPEPIEVTKTFRGVLGDHFVTKFHDYFLRNRIAAFTIKRDIEKPEFDAFLDIWTRWSAKSHQLNPGEIVSGLSDELTKQGILRVTVVGLDEMVGAVRHLNWAVKLALSRLRKDIARLPMLRDVAPDVIRQLKVQAIQDIVRPISKIDLHRDLLLNADLVSEGMTVANDLEIEDTLLAAVPARMAMDVCRLLMDMVAELGKTNPRINMSGRDPRTFSESLRRVTRKALHRIGSSDLPDLRPLLQTAYQAELIPFEELPGYIQRQIRAGQTTDRFVQQYEAYLKDFDQCTDAKAYLKYLNVLLIVLPELTARKENRIVAKVFEILSRHHADEVPPFLGRTRFIDETLTHLDSGKFQDGLVVLAATTPKEEREPLEKGVALFGTGVVPGLVRFLAGTEDVSARKAVCSMLERIGPGAAPFLVDELRAHRHQWYTVRNLINVLSVIGDPACVPSICQYCGHPHPRVREECVLALSRILSHDAEKLLLPFLDDKDDAVVRRTVLVLAGIHCTNLEYLRRLHEVLRARQRNEDEPQELLQVSCLRALMEYERIYLPDEPDFEVVLLEAILPAKWRTRMPGRLGVRRKSDTVVQVGIEALGAIGRSRAEKALLEVADTIGEGLRPYVVATVARIHQRLGGGPAPT